MRLEEFAYELPETLIAQRPLPERGASRLLSLDGVTGEVEDLAFPDLARLLHWAHKGCTEAKRPRFLEGWRQELLGEPIRRFLMGDRSLRMTWSDDELRVDGEPARDD